MAKTKSNGIWKRAGVIITVVVLGVGMVVGYVKNSEEIIDNGKGITDHETRIRAVETAVTEQRVDVKHIKGTLDRIETKLDKK